LHHSNLKIFLDRLETIRQTAARIIEMVETGQGSEEAAG
jgi:hypothetical protein